MFFPLRLEQAFLDACMSKLTTNGQRTIVLVLPSSCKLHSFEVIFASERETKQCAQITTGRTGIAAAFFISGLFHRTHRG